MDATLCDLDQGNLGVDMTRKPDPEGRKLGRQSRSGGAPRRSWQVLLLYNVQFTVAVTTL